MSRPTYARVVTRRQMENRIFLLVGVLAGLAYFVDAITLHLGVTASTSFRVVAGAVVMAATFGYEKYKGRRQRS